VSDAAGYWVQAPAEHTARALEWLAQLVFHPTFPEHKVIKERQAIARERALRDPEFERVLRRLNIVDSLDDAIARRLYGEDPERSLGTAEELARLTRADLVDFHARYYVPGNAGLVIVGPVAKEEVAALVERCFGDLAARPLPPAAAPDDPVGPHTLQARGAVAQDEVTLALGARTVGRAHRDAPALDVLAEIVRQRLLAELRFRRGLTYTPYAYNVCYRANGYFACQATVRKRHAEWANDTLRGELDAVKAGAVRKREVRAAVRTLQADAAGTTESAYDRADELADLILDWPADAALPDAEQAYGAVKVADVVDAWSRYDVPERRFEARLTPLLELNRVKAIARRTGQLALLAVGMGASAFLSRRLCLGTRGAQ
jgi:predicted Zn-dependent peptidase